jgi:serine/threonine protein kinase
MTPERHEATTRPGRVLGERYEVIEELGRGGMSVVYLARQIDLDRLIALKELSAFHATDPSVLQRFLREARLAGSLKHPNIVTVYDSLELNGVPYLAMEYVERGSLRPLIGQLTFPQIAGVLEGVLAGLTHAEEHGVVHRDLKPENLLVTADGRIKIADFGIAKAVNRLAAAQGFMTRTGTAIGTPTYMAPEQATAKTHELGPWTDLYAVGVIAYELAAGRVPFNGSDEPLSIMLMHVRDPVAPPDLAPGLPDEMAGWVLQLLEKRPGDRYPSASEAWEALEDVVIAAVGPRWRRTARLLAEPTGEGVKPLTPSGLSHVDEVTPQPESEPGYESFVWPRRAVERAAPEPQPGADAPAPPDESPVPLDESSALPDEPPEVEPSEGSVPTVAPLRPLPEAEPEPEPPVARRRPWVRVAGIGVVVVAAAVAGVVLGRPGDEPEPSQAPAEESASSGIASMAFTSPWRRAPENAPGRPRLRMRDAVSLTRDRGPGEWAVLGTTAATGPSLVSDALAADLTEPPGAGTPVQLGDQQAVKHDRLRMRAGSALSLVAIPTDNGIATLACVGPEITDALAADCDGLATRLRVSAKPYALPPRPGYARRVAKVLETLEQDRRRALKAFRQADLPAGQARAAGGAGDAFRQAGRKLADVEPSPVEAPTQRAIAEALAVARDGYAAMERSARSGTESAYDAGRESALAGESRLARAVRSLERLGYEVTP